ncbi:MAG TPA: glycosyltransferase [Bacteroidales bacterium]|jgi:glycosyltransferase involved in cell wall biosynthesis|nr:glycosyltransferase [Bacteroidales bacterium]
MKIVQVQYSSKSGGGAALKLHNAFLDAGIDSHILTLHDDINDTDRVIYCGRKAKIMARIEDMISDFVTRKSKKEFGLFSYPFLGTDISQHRVIKEADIIYIHWVQKGFLNISGYRKIAETGKPVIIFMHDMWSITGGCHHSFTCEKYKTKCYDCQFFPGHKKNDLSAKGFRKKMKLYSGFSNLYFVSPSKWLKECAESSSLTRNREIFLIPNLLDRKIFRPVDKKVARVLLNIDNGNSVIAFGALAIDSPYKGWEYLKNALDKLSGTYRETTISVLIFGKCNVEVIRKNIPFDTVFTGYLKDEYSAALVYNAADVFVTPSLADNLPTTVLESLSCGTPVVGFRTGGIPDMIEHKINGYLAEYRNSDDLAEGIKYCLSNNIRGKISAEFENENIISRHMNLVNRLVNKTSH